jgi:hypothetical protein
MAKVRSLIQKGRNFQSKIRDILMETFSLDQDSIRTAIGSETGVDIKLTKKAQELIGLSIECKNQKSLSIWAALEQAKSNTYSGTIPALIFHRSVSGNKDIWMAIPIEHYMELRKKLLEQ